MVEYRDRIWRGLGSGIALLVLPLVLHAQDCERREPRPWFGVHTFHCRGGICKVHGAIARTSTAALVGVGNPARSPYRYDFSVEPSLWGIHEDGPAAGKLEDGDVLVAVNDRAVTTMQASEELEHLEVGTPVRLTVRRGSRLVDVEVAPSRSCAAVWVSAGVEPPSLWEERGRVQVGLSDSARLRALVERSPALHRALAGVGRRTGSGFLGVAIRCGECELILSAEAGGSRFRFNEYPEVVEVAEGSLAERAGLHPGDVLTHVNGKDLRTEAGADRLARLILRPGERVEIRYVRSGEPRTGVAVYEPAREP